MIPFGWLTIISQRLGLQKSLLPFGTPLTIKPVSLPTFPVPPVHPLPLLLAKQLQRPSKTSTALIKPQRLSLSDDYLISDPFKLLQLLQQEQTSATTQPEITYSLHKDVLHIVAKTAEKTYELRIRGWSYHYRPTLPKRFLLSTEDHAARPRYIRDAFLASQTVPALTDTTTVSYLKYAPTSTSFFPWIKMLENSTNPFQTPAPSVVVATPAKAPEVTVDKDRAREHEPQLSISSSLSNELITKLTELITRLKREIESQWPYPNKDLKQYKMRGLNELIDLAKRCSVQDALAQIEKKYPKIKEGRISTRTADLFNEIDRFGQQNDRPMPI